MTMLPVLVLGLCLGLTALAILVYAMVRLSGWSPDDGAPVTSARMHGFAMAVIATLAVLFAVFLLMGLVDDGFTDHQTTDAGDRQGATATEFPTSPLEPVSAALAAALPSLFLLGVYAVAQRTWPRPAGPVRNARLAARRPLDYVPWPLLWVTVGSGLAAVAAVVLAWSTPEVQALHLWYASGTQTLGTYTQGSRPGTGFAPWLVLALVLLAAATAAVIVLVARRPPLTGLSTVADEAVRRVAVHRVLRTAAAAALAVSLVAVTAWSSGVRAHAERAAAGSLEALADEFATNITITAEGPVHTLSAPPVDVPLAVDALMAGAPIAVLLGSAVLLFWRPTAARVVRATSS
ncbi:hypothetical protein [Citricoccus nitrophenolicus]|uniref:hypothetical protein n=1 Tax=Citricoccus nitrophenolicus TaxID=863575 RepID=UPI0031EE1186